MTGPYKIRHVDPTVMRWDFYSQDECPYTPAIVTGAWASQYIRKCSYKRSHFLSTKRIRCNVLVPVKDIQPLSSFLLLSVTTAKIKNLYLTNLLLQPFWKKIPTNIQPLSYRLKLKISFLGEGMSCYHFLRLHEMIQLTSLTERVIATYRVNLLNIPHDEWKHMSLN